MNIETDFKQIYNAYAPKVYRLCLGYATGDKELAKEWQQETFIKVWNHRKGFKANSAISTWIYRIAVNTCLSDLRKSKKVIRMDETAIAETLDDEPSEAQDAAIQKMYRCIDTLNANNKAIILLELEDVPQATIAQLQGMAHGALRTRLNRIKQFLLKCITDEK